MFKQIKSKTKMDNLMKVLSNGARVLDFNKINELGFPINIVISERARRGKTLNMKEFLREEFGKGNKAVALTNSEGVTHTVQKEFFVDLTKPFVRKNIGEKANEFWSKCKFYGSKEKNTLSLEVCTYDKKEIVSHESFLRFIHLNTSNEFRGSRDNYRHIWWDEFNIGFDRIKYPIIKINSLLHTLQDVVAKTPPPKMWIMGNYKTLANEFLHTMGIFTADFEVTEFWKDNIKMALIIVPQITEDEREDIEEEYKNDWIFQFSKAAGQHRHAYYNEKQSETDNANFVIADHSKIPKKNPFHILKVDEKHFGLILDKKVRKKLNGQEGLKSYIDKAIWVELKKGDKRLEWGYNNKKVIAIHKRDMVEGCILRVDFRFVYLNWFQKAKMYADSLMVRKWVLSALVA